MLTVADYDLLVLRGFEALRREIDEAEQFTVSHYNQLKEQSRQRETSNNDNQSRERVVNTENNAEVSVEEPIKKSKAK